MPAHGCRNERGWNDPPSSKCDKENLTPWMTGVDAHTIQGLGGTGVDHENLGRRIVARLAEEIDAREDVWDEIERDIVF
jgi:hypothetical protein